VRPVLEVEDLRLSFDGIAALAGASLEVAEGEAVSVIGPNGSGKTSLINCITGFYRPEEGRIAFAGESLLGDTPDRVARRRIARTFQDVRLFERLSVLDNLMVGRHLLIRRSLADALLGRREEDVAHRRRCEEILESLRLAAWRRTLAGECPFGVQKRVELARAMAAEPRLLLLDEPTAGLALRERQEIADWIAEARRLSGLTLLVIEHDVQFAAGLGSRMIAMDGGKVVADGPPAEVRAHASVVGRDRGN
jgi:branched-chain amino acid transport system ATP-binding protein